MSSVGKHQDSWAIPDLVWPVKVLDSSQGSLSGGKPAVVVADVVDVVTLASRWPDVVVARPVLFQRVQSRLCYGFLVHVSGTVERTEAFDMGLLESSFINLQVPIGTMQSAKIQKVNTMSWCLSGVIMKSDWSTMETRPLENLLATYYCN